MIGRPTGLRTTKKLGYFGIEQVARKIRRWLAPELPPTSSLPGLSLFEQLDRLSVSHEGRRIPLDYACNDLPDSVAGATMYDSKRNAVVITLSNRTYHELRAQNPRARFSLFHELSHACIHIADLIRLSLLPHHQGMALLRQEVTHDYYEDTEWQANATAGALLIPAEGIHHLERTTGNVTALNLAECYGVSKAAAERRLDVYQRRRDDLLSALLPKKV